MATEYELKKSLPNKMVNENNTITDLAGNAVTNAVTEYENKPALPNKWLNPDGTYSTLNEIIASMVDTSIYVVVDELPSDGNIQKIYLVSDKKGGFVEYHWTGEKWDPIGMVEFNLSDYSTTKEMMNAIEAAGVLTSNSAKAYADTLFGNVVPEVYYLTKNPAGRNYNWPADAIAELQAIIDTNSDKPCIIIASGSSTGDSIYFSKTHKLKGSLTFNMLKHQYENRQPSYGYSVSMASALTVNITVSDGIITKVTSDYSNNEILHFIDPTVSYTNPFNPTQPYHPATKKYVDDSIATNITEVLNKSF